MKHPAKTKAHLSEGLLEGVGVKVNGVPGDYCLPLVDHIYNCCCSNAHPISSLARESAVRVDSSDQRPIKRWQRRGSVTPAGAHWLCRKPVNFLTLKSKAVIQGEVAQPFTSCD